MSDLRYKLSGLIGQDAWGVRIGIGTHLLLEFGAIREIEDGKIGDFSVWVPGAPWRLDDASKIIAGSGQDDLSIDSVQVLNGDKITDIVIEETYFEVKILWESGLRLSVMSENSDEDTIVFFVCDEVFVVDGTGQLITEQRKS